VETELTDKKKILFVCTQNSARSQMAEGLMRALYGDRYEVFSAGTEPSQVNPFAIQAMELAKIDISNHRSKSIDEFNGEEMDYVVTVCDRAKENCPYFPGGKVHIHHSFSDPAAVSGSDVEILAEFERIRDEIKKWIKESIGQGLI
jgi:arsenate reductase